MSKQALDLLREMNLYFTSGNEVPIEKASIKASEWRELFITLEAALACPKVMSEKEAHSLVTKYHQKVVQFEQASKDGINVQGACTEVYGVYDQLMYQLTGA